ncbi:MAG: ribosome-binding factor A [Bacteroidales bacterium]|nr:ribosome-binding factor A [Bacteroidales bacterium]
METTRQQKVARLIQKDLGMIFQEEGVSAFGGAMITVTKVYVTRDMSVARVYLSLFSTPDKEGLMELIRSNTREIRYKLGIRIGKQVRVIPDLAFYIDDSLDYIERIEKLLGN